MLNKEKMVCTADTSVKSSKPPSFKFCDMPYLRLKEKNLRNGEKFQGIDA